METRKRIYCALGGFILGVLVTLVIWMFSVSGIGTDVPADSDGVLGQENGIGREETDVADGAGKAPGEDGSPSGSDPAPPTEVAAKEPGEDTGSAGDGGVAVPEPSVGTWDKSAVYTGGDTVSYGGRRYRAKWWTQGEQPDRSDVWEDFGIWTVSRQNRKGWKIPRLMRPFQRTPR